MRKYVLTIVVDPISDQLTFESMNDGFSVFELISLLDAKKQDLLDQLNHQAKFTRTAFDQDGVAHRIEENTKGTDEQC